MNWIIILVLLVVALMVPVSLIAVFAVSKDTRQYSKHYDKDGFSLEACNEDGSRVANPDGIMVSKQKKQDAKSQS